MFVVILLLTASCKNKESKRQYTPWGTVVDDGEGESNDLIGNSFSLADIQENGELIMLTLSGPTTYYDYKGVGLGTDYLLCEKFANTIGVSVRVELCKDTTEMLNKLKSGKGDLIAYPLNNHQKLAGVTYCGAIDKSIGAQWVVNKDNASLAQALNDWYQPEMLQSVKKEEKKILAQGLIVHKSYAPMLDSKGGVISKYDFLFKKYSPVGRVDWRLMAAQCYTESGFDTYAKSWAGYCGLMAIMPNTARELGIAVSSLTDPETNIAASAQVMAKLEHMLQDIGDPFERLKFKLASYNAGIYHIRDAMTLTRQNGKNPHRWEDVAEYVLKLSAPAYYKLPSVKCGYMRGSETVNYVARIMQRWSSYCGSARGGGDFSSGIDHSIPQRATKKYKYDV